MKLISWNVNGIRAATKKGFSEFVAKKKPDVLCIQEAKISKEDYEKLDLTPKGYKYFSSWAKKKGYSGVIIFVKEKIEVDSFKDKIGKKAFDDEGRFSIIKVKNLVIYNIYFPSGTSGEIRQDFKYKFLNHVKKHFKENYDPIKHKLIVCGDFNICHKEIDIHHPETASKRELSGFLPKERLWMDQFSELGFIDTFRYKNPKTKNKYSWWSYRAGSRGKNLGWRIDYFFVSTKLEKNIKSAKILSEVEGSDHCPLTLNLDL